MTTYPYHASPELSNANPDGVPREGNVVVGNFPIKRPRRKQAPEEPRFDESSVTSEMKLRLLEAISEDVDGNSVKVANLLMLKYRNGRTGRCCPDRETLADDAECSVRTIAYCTKQLQDRKWIRVKHRRDNSNLYYFAWERLRVLDQLPGIVDALVAVKNQQDFERAWIERVGSSGDELDRYIRRIGKPGYIKGFVEELLLLKVIEGERDVEHAWHRRFAPPPDPEHAERVLEGTSARKLRGHRMRALEDRARRDDASAWAILQGSVRRHRETIGVLIHRLIDARVSLSNEEEEVGDTLRLPDPRAEGRRNQAPARSTARAGARPPPPRHR
jgi:hypothetical protein